MHIQALKNALADQSTFFDNYFSSEGHTPLRKASEAVYQSFHARLRCSHDHNDTNKSVFRELLFDGALADKLTIAEK